MGLVPVPEGRDIGRRTEKKNCKEPDSIAQTKVLQRHLPQPAAELVLLVLVLLEVERYAKQLLSQGQVGVEEVAVAVAVAEGAGFGLLHSHRPPYLPQLSKLPP